MMRIAVVANTSWYVSNFRLNLMRALSRAGHVVIGVAPRDEYSDRIEAAGFPFEHVSITGKGVNPVTELRAVASLVRIFRRQKIDLVLSYTPKGNLYSALGCIALRQRFVPNVSGLGSSFIRRSAITAVVETLYRTTFRRAEHVFFQNRDDLELFILNGLVKRELAERIPGSGVDVDRFSPSAMQRSTHSGPTFLLAARLLWDKGIGEYVEAARIVRRVIPSARFQLLGYLDVDNPSVVPERVVRQWNAEGAIEYLGSTDDVRPYLRQSDCVVLPSYREGLPRILLEAAASARPIIATNVPGCRDVVVDGRTGFLCELHDATDLAEKMLRIARMPASALAAMGIAGRLKIEAEFDERFVIRRYLEVVQELQSERSLALDDADSETVEGKVQ